MLVLKTMTHDVPPPYVPADWTTGTDAEIIDALEKHYAGKVNLHQYWNIGAEREISIPELSDAIDSSKKYFAQTITLVLMNEGGKQLVEGGECAFVVGVKELLSTQYGTGGLNPYTEDRDGVPNGGWQNTVMRTWLNSTFKMAIPQTIRPIFKEFVNYSNNSESDLSRVSTHDYFSLPAEKEITGTISEYTGNASVWENETQFYYYETSSNRIKNYKQYKDAQGSTTNNKAGDYWNRTGTYYSSSVIRFMCTDKNGNVGGVVQYAASNSSGISPFGVI